MHCMTSSHSHLTNTHQKPSQPVCPVGCHIFRGILIKGGSALDALDACGTVALDKTGTLTTGALTLTERFTIHTPAAGGAAPAAVALPLVGAAAIAAADADGAGDCGSGCGSDFETAALRCAVALSRLSSHPVSRAMVDFGDSNGVGHVTVTGFEQVRCSPAASCVQWRLSNG